VVFASPPPASIGVSPLPGPSIGFPLTPGPAVGAPAGAVLVHRLAPLPPDATVVGDLVVEVGDDPSRGDDIVVVPRCIQPGAPLLASPPSAAEIWQETPLPRTVIRASPPGTVEWPGITRLGSDFWSDGLGPTSASVVLRGFAVDVVAVPIGYAWSFGQGTDLVSPDAGTRTRIAYLRRGEFTVTRYVVWEGVARLSAFGLDFGVIDLGTVTIPERARYRVGEIRSLLRTPPGRR
jgi:hypothetical protein